MCNRRKHLRSGFLGIAVLVVAAQLGAPGCQQSERSEPADVTSPGSGTNTSGSVLNAVADQRTEGDATLIFEGKLPPGYRDWGLISVAREEGDLDDIRAVLGNDVAIKAYREGKSPYPDGTVIARLAWSYDSSEENNKAFGRRQSFVAGHPKNGVQFMVKDAKKYASTGGWKYAHFDDGKPFHDAAALQSCFDCHGAVKDRDYVFTRMHRDWTRRMKTGVET